MSSKMSAADEDDVLAELAALQADQVRCIYCAAHERSADPTPAIQVKVEVVPLPRLPDVPVGELPTAEHTTEIEEPQERQKERRQAVPA